MAAVPNRGWCRWPTADRPRPGGKILEVSSTAENYDIVVIGGGPGGYAAALYGASAGLNIALVEKAKLGGTCLHVGCIPAKELLETASVVRHVAGAKEFGVDVGPPALDLTVTQARKQRIIDNLTKGLAGLLKGRKVTVYDGVGILRGDRQVNVSGGESGSVDLTADQVILAAGSVPRTLPGFDVDGRIVMSSDELLAIDQLPAKTVVIGGGAIGLEFASMLADLGSQVTVLEAADKILPGCDADVAKLIERAFKKRGITIRTGVAVSGHSPGGTGTTVSFGDGETLDTGVVVVSIGRRPFADLLDLSGTGVVVDERGFVIVDQFGLTAAPGVYAVGDITNTPQLAHIGFAEGMLAIKHLLGEEPLPIDYQTVPWCIYTHPEIAYAGHSEGSAREAGFDIVVSKHRFMGNGRAMIVGETDGMVKVVAERQPDGTGGRILGVHMVGPWVTEQLGQGYMAVNWEATVDEVAAFIQPHPTMSELFGESALALTGRSLHG